MVDNRYFIEEALIWLVEDKGYLIKKFFFKPQRINYEETETNLKAGVVFPSSCKKNSNVLRLGVIDIAATR